MIAGVMDGGGLERLAELASEEARGAVAIVVPRLGEALAPPSAVADEDVARLRSYVRRRVAGRPSELPELIEAEAPVSTGGEVLGAVLLLSAGGSGPAPRVSEILTVTAMATLTELAVANAREQADEALRSSLIELIRADHDLSDDEILRRAHRLGSDLSMGAVALCAELTGRRPRHAMTIIRDEQPQALAENIDDRVYALIPPAPGDDPAQGTLESARRLTKALAAHATVGFSSFCTQPRRFHRAIAEAELVVDVLTHEASESSDDDIRSSTYRLLINTLASRPDEVRQFYEETVAPLVAYDEQYNSDLVGTVEAYLRHNCSMNATASAIYAHRHTVAYRLDRVRELTGLDASVSEDRERLGLGLKAYRILGPQLRR
jgi:sugar diacid utilization regulator